MARQTASASSNIYTVLAFIALGMLLGGIIYAFIRLNELGIDPFKVPENSTALLDTARALGLA